MKYLLAVLFLSLVSAHASSISNDAIANATVITVPPTGAAVVNAGLLTANTVYRIESVGTTDFTLIGADSNLVGVVFSATGAGTGTGSASKVATFSGNNMGATAEDGEPVHATVGAGKSVWWAWTPTAAGTATIDTSGSSFDTVLAVYTSTTFAASITTSNLTAVAYSDDLLRTNQASKVAFTVRSGTTYYIAVDGYQGGAQAAAGAIKLNVSLGGNTYAAQNDNYADRAVVAGDYSVVNGDSLLATIEPGEANLAVSFFDGFFFFLGDTKSVWWTWTAPRAGQVTITSKMDINSEFNGDNLEAVLALFTGRPANIEDLAFLAYTTSPTFTPSETATLKRTVTSGEVLQIRVSSYDAFLGAQIQLTVAMNPTVGNIINDQFVKRTLLTGSSVFVKASNAGATSEPGEPAHYAEVPATNIVSGSSYIINTIGTTDFTALGAVSNTVGLEFKANRSGSGTGTAILLRPAVAQSLVVVTAGSFIADQQYIINTVGTTQFTLIGALDNLPGTVFTAQSAGSGTGTAILYNSTINGLFNIGQSYRIESSGTTDFTKIGAINNNPGTTFTATGTGNKTVNNALISTGTALPVEIVPAGSFVKGRNYWVESLGTDFTQIGGANIVGTPFQATGAGTGSGSASTLAASESVWWTWVAPSDGYVNINTAGSVIETLLHIYTGNSLDKLVTVASVDGTGSAAVFKVVKGVSYQIAVDSAEATREAGALNLSLNFISDAPIITTQVQNQAVNVLTGPAVFTIYNTGAAAVYDWQIKAPGSSTWAHYADGVLTGPPSEPNGVVSATLTVAGVPPTLNGAQFRCVITNVGGQVTSQTATLTVVSATAYMGSPESLSVAGSFTIPSGYTIAYYAKGLPKGLTINQSTGLISGRFAGAPKVYTITYWAVLTNPATKKKTTLPNQTLAVTGLAFPSALSGSFEGLLLTGAGLPAGKVELVVAITGAFTGKLTYQGKVIGLKGALTLDAYTPPAIPASGSVTLTPASGWNLAITVRNNATMTATVTGGPGGPVKTNVGLVDGVKIRTYGTTTPAPWAGAYTLAFTDPTYAVLPGAGPKGSGYATVTISSTGQLTFKGKVADGTIIAASLYPDTAINGTYRPYVQLYTNKLGSLSGFLPLSPRGVNTSLYHVNPLAGLDFYWSKVPFGNDKGSFPGGFTSTGLSLRMEPWIAPTNQYLLGLLGLVTANSQTIGNFNLVLDQYTVGGISNAPLTPPDVNPLPSVLTMGATGMVSVLPGASNPSNWTIKITYKSGNFQGSFLLADKRKVGFEGVLLQFPSGTTAANNQFGQGFFLVPASAGGRPTTGDVNFTGLITLP